jgi:hypothetical protein
MANTKWNQIGAYNKQLVLDLRNAKTMSSGFPLSDFLHGPYWYDIKGYGLYGNDQKRRLESGWSGTKYYCFKSDGNIDMRNRIVHIYKENNGVKSEQIFFRLTHSPQGGRDDNQYQSCETITDIGIS